MSLKSQIEIMDKNAENLARGLLERAARATLIPLIGDSPRELAITFPATPQPRIAPVSIAGKKRAATESRDQKYGHIMARAARKAGKDNLKFCSLLDKEDVPTLWPEFQKWKDAYMYSDANGEFVKRGAIRNIKRRAIL